MADGEAKAFWPIDDAYQNDLKVINERRRNAILAYAEAYKAGLMTIPASSGCAANTTDAKERR